MSVGGRFDLDSLREQARAEKKAARVKAIVSNVLTVVVLAAVAGGGWWGWNAWCAKRERDAQEALEAQQQAERHERAEKERAEKERVAREEKRRQEQEAREEKRRLEREAREEAQRKKTEEAERARREKVEARERAEKDRVEQEDRRKYAERLFADLRYSISAHLAYEYGLDECCDVTVAEPRWLEFVQLADGRHALEFYEKLREETNLPELEPGKYPSRDALDTLVAKLSEERFTMVMKSVDDKLRGRSLEVVAVGLDGTVDTPEGARALKNGGRQVGWTIPFVKGDDIPYFVVSTATASAIRKEWSAKVAEMKKNAAKINLNVEEAERRLNVARRDFVASVKMEIDTPPPPPEDKKSSASKKREGKRKLMMKGPTRR